MCAGESISYHFIASFIYFIYFTFLFCFVLFYSLDFLSIWCLFVPLFQWNSLYFLFLFYCAIIIKNRIRFFLLVSCFSYTYHPYMYVHLTSKWVWRLDLDRNYTNSVQRYAFAVPKLQENVWFGHINILKLMWYSAASSY